MIGFSFKGKHTSDFGASVRTKSRPIVAEPKVFTYELSASDGDIDMSAKNEYNRMMFKSRLFEEELTICADSLFELEKKAAKVASWLRGSGTLIFDDSNGCVWQAYVCSDIPFVPEHRGKTAVLSVVFHVNMGEAEFDTITGAALGDTIRLGADIPLDIGDKFCFELSYGENDISFLNIGDFEVRPVLYFSEGPTEITVSYKDKQIGVENLETDVYIDNEKCILTNALGANLLKKKNGAFFEILPGRCDMTVNVNSACEMKIKYVPRTMFDFDFEQIDWGDNDAQTV